jgi:multiple sugar transport system permease protein
MKRRKSFLTPRTRNTISGVLFCLPWIVGLVVIYGGPIVTSFWWSFTDYRIMNPPEWIGLKNYVELVGDSVVRLSVSNSLTYAAMAIPAQVIGGIGLALLLNTKVRGRAVYRSVYYFPTLVPAVASAVLWRWMLDPQWGLVNALLRRVGLPAPGWIGSVTWAKPSLVLISVWGMGNSVVIYLASLQDVPRSLYDAAEVDGANAWQKVRHVTVPMITPVIFFNLIMGLIGAFQFFALPYVMTRGDGSPGQSLLFYSMVLYRQAFLYLKMGYGATMAWMLFLFILICTLIIYKTSGRWVYYGGGG